VVELRRVAIVPALNEEGAIGGVIDELTSVPLDLALPSPKHDDASPQASITAATPPPSMLLLVGTGLTGLAGMVRRRLTRRNRIAW